VSVEWIYCGPQQAGQLQKHFRSAVLMLDGDTAGQAATEGDHAAVVADHGC
jgi:hypothetical protein